MTVEWRMVPGCPYGASNDGRIRRVGVAQGAVVGRELQQRTSPLGYKTVQLRVGGRHRHRFAHSLVALAFLGEPPEGQQTINHKNGIKADNRPENLEWVSHRQNIAHAVANGLTAVGERAGNARLTEAAVVEIRALYATVGPEQLSAKYGVSVGAIYDAAFGLTWRHVSAPALVSLQRPGARGSSNTRSKITEDDVRLIRAEYTGAPGQMGALAARFGVSRSLISKIVFRRNWKHIT